jgi:methyl-accepting chemotaxis protein
MATIKSKIIFNTLIVLFTVLGIVAMNFFDLNHLGNLQDKGSKRAFDALRVQEASFMGLKLNGVVADAMINRDLETVAKEWKAVKDESLEDMKAMAAIADIPAEKELVDQATKEMMALIDVYENRLLPLLKTSADQEKLVAVNHEIDTLAARMGDYLTKFNVFIAKDAKDADENFDRKIKSAVTEALIIGVFGVLLQAGLAGWLLRTIMKPVNVLRMRLEDIAHGEGDLTKRLDETTKDELADVSRFFNQFMDKLRGIIISISETSSQVASASNELHVAAERIASGAGEVAARSVNVATAGEEMAATSGDIAQNCQMAAEGAQRATQSAQNGAVVVEKTVTVMAQIARKVQETAKTVERLGARSDQIGEIIGTIEDIADQTNLLALNAAIEAARAGEQGRGFAVVADEVRALAERTTKATREIGEMIKAIQNETKGAVIAMEQGVSQVETGTVEAAKSGEALREILEHANDVAMQVNQIATAAEEQTATTGEISSSMQQITDAGKGASDGAHESAAAAAQLHGNAQVLQQLVRQFKV